MRRGLIMIAVLLLTACHVDTTVDIAMGSDGAGKITVTAVADAGVLAQAPGLADDLRFDDAKTAGWTLTGPAATSDGGLRVELSHPFASPQEATALLLSINGTGGPLHNATFGRAVTQSGTTITFAGTLRIDGLGAFADPDVLSAVGATPYAEQVAASAASPTAAVGVTIRAALPGKIKSTTGTIKDGAVSWIVPLDGSQLDLSTTATDDHGTARIWGVAANVALIALITWCVLAAGFVTWVVKARQRRTRNRPPRVG